VIEREISDAPLGGRQCIAHLPDALEYSGRTAARAIRQLLRENRRHAEKRRILGRDHIRGHVLQIRFEPALRLEAPTERRAREHVAQTRHDTAADIDSAQRAERHRDVARERAENPAEHVNRLGRERIAVEAFLDDLRHFERRGHALLVASRERAIDHFDAGPGGNALERHVRPLLARVLQHEVFALVHGRERRVAAFAAERDPAVVGGNQARHAHARARTEQADHAVLPPRAAADLHALRIGEARQRHRERGEVVHDEQCVEAELTARRFDRECPVVIGHADLIAIDGIRNRNRRMIHATDLAVLQILLDDFCDTRIVRARIDENLRDFAGTGFKRKARIGAADVGKQPRSVGVLARARGSLSLHTSRHRVLLPCRSPTSRWHFFVGRLRRL